MGADAEARCRERRGRAVTTPYDDLPAEGRREAHGWFGDPWWSYVCYDEAGRLVDEMRKPFPAGESCLYCEEPFAEGDSGQAVPFFGMGESGIRHVHKECQFRQVAGGLAHHEGRCRCHGGDGTTPGMTVRQEALEVWRRMQAGTLFR
jgi:hypothetical protein